MTETFSITEVFQTVRPKFVSLTEASISIVETLFRQTSKALTDTFTLSEAITTLRTRMTSFVETFSLTETFTRLIAKAFTETIQIQEFFKRYLNGILVMFTDKYKRQNTSYSDKNSARGTSYSDKYHHLP